MDRDFLTPSEVVTELLPGMTPGGLKQLRFRGIGPRFYKPSPKKVLYRRSDVLEWLEDRVQATREQPTTSKTAMGRAA